MKKITLMAALLGSAYFANAQVGIGTPTPATSAMLDITATNKGVLIPRVALTTNDDQTTVTTPTTSLLVYNTNPSADAVAPEKKVTPGFYYWNVNKWERIVSQTDLTNAIEDVNAELGDIINLLQTAYPSNNLNDSTTTGADLGGGMVFTPATGTEGEAGYVPAKIEYVYYNGTTYVKQDMTSLLNDLIEIEEGNVIYNPTTQVFQYWNGNSYEDISLEDIVQGFETKTTIVTIDNVQYYLSESFNKFAELAAATTDTSKLAVLNSATANSWIKIDVVGGVVNNIEEIFTTTTTIVINEGETNQQTFTTVQEYIEYISQNAMQEGVTKIVITDGQASFQTWNNTTNTWESVSNTSFSTIVKANQSLTDITKTYPTTHVINYVYTAEPALDGTARTFTIDLTQDLIDQITNNQNVQNAITNLTLGNGSVFYNGTGSAILVGGVSIPADTFYLINENGEGEVIDLGNIVVNEVVENFNIIVNSPVTINGENYTTVEEYIQHIAETSDANVGFTTTEITADNNLGGLAIPENSFYYINDAGVKVIIPLGDIVYQGITQLTETQVTGVKTKLGDKIVTNSSVVTGDTYNGKAVRRGVYTTTITANTANTTGVTLDVAASEIISITVKYNGGLVANVTDLTVSNTTVGFNIGTGNMYQVLGDTEIVAEVIIEFTTN